MPIATVRQTRLYRQIADQLQTLIRSGEFSPGSKLPPERELSSQLGVSRASVREALIALEVLGEVEVRVGHGVVVCDTQHSTHQPVMRAAAQSEPWPLDPEIASELELNADDEEIPPLALLQARRHVEPETAALAATHATAADLESLHDALARNIRDNQTAGGGDFVGDRLLHIRIAEASGNAAYALLLKHLLGRRYGAMFRRLQAHHMEQEMWLHSQADHERIVAAIEAGVAADARAAMQAHLDHVLDVFFAQ